MNINLSNVFVKFILSKIQRYDHEKYWKMRSEVTNPLSKKPKWLRYIYLYKIKKSDTFHNASMGTDMGQGAEFATAPKLLHGLSGIFIGHSAKIGANVTICQQVSIMQGNEGLPVIGDNCFIGAGAKILGHVKIGDNVTVGTNAVVTKDVPPNCTVAGVPAKPVTHQ